MLKSIALLFCMMTGLSISQAQTKTEKSVASALERLRAAMLNGDQQALEQITSDQLSYGHSSGKIQTKAEFVNSLVTKESDFVTLDFTNVSIILSGNTALVRHQLTAETADGGKPGSVKLGVFLVWQKQGSSWRLLGRQAYKL